MFYSDYEIEKFKNKEYYVIQRCMRYPTYRCACCDCGYDFLEFTVKRKLMSHLKSKDHKNMFSNYIQKIITDNDEEKERVRVRDIYNEKVT